MQVIEITYFKLNGKHHSVITVPCFRMLLLYDRASERNNFDINLTRKDWAFITYKQRSHLLSTEKVTKQMTGIKEHPSY